MLQRSIIMSTLLVTALAASTVAADPAEELKRYMDACVQVDKFNGSISVAKDGEVVFSQGYGMANFEHDVANSPETKFRIGSITKQFTAMAVMILQEKGKLDVEDPISEHLDGTPESWKPITIHHLLTHTSGIPNYTSMANYGTDMALPQSIEQMVARFRDKPLEFTPGDEFNYSNSGYFLLGAIIEETSGMSYEDFLHKQIFAPLDLKNTGYDRYQSVLKHRAAGYDRQSDAVANAAYLDMSQPYAAGSLYSTVEDLTRWDEALRGQKLISEESYQQMYKPEKNDYAYGWAVREESGRQSIGHGGGINGFVTHIRRYPQEDLCVVVLSNVIPANPGRISSDLASIMLGESYELPRERVPAEVDPKVFDSYEGKYQLQPRMVVTIKREAEKLTAELTGQRVLVLTPESETVFFHKGIDVVITFETDKSGKAVALEFQGGGRKIRAARIKEPGKQSTK